MRWLKRILLAALLLVLVVGAGLYGSLAWYGERVKDPAFFESDIRAFEDEIGFPEHPVLFVGSSSIRMWDSLEADMAPLPVVNRGFGGSQMFHLVHFAERIIVPAKPRAIVVYAGDNDLDESTGKTAEVVLEDFQRFVAIAKRLVPAAPVYYLSIKPSRLRWERWSEMSRANELIAEWTQSDPQLRFIDTGPALLDPEGSPRDDVFLFDGLHLNATGYAGWTRIVRPRLLADLSPPPTGG